MSRARGNRKSDAAVEQRREKVAEALGGGAKTRAEIAAEVGTNLAAVKRDLAALAQRFEGDAKAAFAEFRRAQLAVFELIEKNLVEGSVEPEVAREWRAIRSEISKLLGLNAENRSIVAHVGARQDRMFLEFKKHAAGLDEGQLREAFALMDSMERKPAVKDASWYPSPELPALGEGARDAEEEG